MISCGITEYLLTFHFKIAYSSGLLLTVAASVNSSCQC